MPDELGPAWLAAQRWFRAKQRPIASLAEVDRARIGPGELRVLEVQYAGAGEPDRYLVPTIHDREPRDGEGVWRALVTAVAGETALGGVTGSFVCTRTDALAALLDPESAPAERRLKVEQTNTSVVVGDRLILKLYRLLEPGENPDVEMSAFLTDAGFTDTPALAGAITYRGGAVASSAAMLQAFVPSHGDAWQAMLSALASDASAATRIAAEVGQVTGRMHAALASRPADPSFPARPATGEESAAWRASAEGQLAQALDAVRGPERDRLIALAPQVSERLAEWFTSASGAARVTRIHGDYHLGQVLARRDGGFSVIDFEGEPARPLAERRRPSSPLRDVAGMLRSLDYGARTAEAGPHAPGFDADRWLDEARGAFLEAYGGIGAPEAGLLNAFELEKACYEVRYEANNRPGWLWLPLAAVERLIGGSSPGATA